LQPFFLGALQPLFAPFLIFFIKILAQVGDLLGFQGQCQRGQSGGDLLGQDRQAGPDVVLKPTGLLNRQVLTRQGDQPQHRLVDHGQLLLAVPRLQGAQFGFEGLLLFAVQVKLAMQPPLQQKRTLVVSGFDHAAA